MKRRSAVLLAVLFSAVAMAGFGIDLAIGDTNTASGCVTASATAAGVTVPGHSVGVDGAEVKTIPGVTIAGSSDVETACVTVTSPPNSTVTATGPTTTSSSPPFYAERFDGAFTLGLATAGGAWKEALSDPGASRSFAAGFSGQALRLTDASQTKAGVNYGQMAAIYADAPYAHAGMNVSTGTGNGYNDEAWYRFKTHFPADYKATPGSQNNVFEIHIDQKTCSVVTCYSFWLGVLSDGTINNFNTVPGTNPRLQLHTSGGTNYGAGTYHPLSAPLLLDHWYDVVLHVKWGETAAKGLIQWWLDGTKVLDVAEPTQYQRPDGTLSYGQSIGFYNYRLWANWTSSIDDDEFMVGPTASSVGFTP